MVVTYGGYPFSRRVVTMARNLVGWYIAICLALFLFLTTFGGVLFSEATLKIIGGVVVFSVIVYVRWFHCWNRKFNLTDEKRGIDFEY